MDSLEITALRKQLTSPQIEPSQLFTNRFHSKPQLTQYAHVRSSSMELKQKIKKAKYFSKDYISLHKKEALTILRFFRYTHLIYKLYKKKLNEIVTKAIVKLQRFFKNKVHKIMFRKSIVQTTLSLNCLDADQVKLVGQFGSTQCVQQGQQWSAQVMIQVGSLFRFKVNDLWFMTSDDYPEVIDESGSRFNVFRFHPRSKSQNDQVIQSYHAGRNEGYKGFSITIQAKLVFKKQLLRLNSAGYSRGKTSDYCEDAYFVCQHGFGVADGVSGWNDFGFSSKEFASQLMFYCKKEINQNPDKKVTCILKKAYKQVRAIGSSTAVVGLLSNNKLAVCNLGDSGFQLYRPSRDTLHLAHRSKEQSHGFNIPFQLANLPSVSDCEKLYIDGKVKESIKLKRVLRQKVCQDEVAAADVYCIDAQQGDYIVTATDGVFDNLFNFEIQQILVEGGEVADLAKNIVLAASAKVKEGKTPFQRKYKQYFNCTMEGGKEDDMTAVVSQVYF